MPSQEHTVLVLGAGASLAEAITRRPKRTKEHPPLDSTFFRNARRHRNVELLHQVEAQAATLGERDLTGDSPPVSLEAHLGRLYFEINHNPLRASTQAYFDAVTLYAWEITATTNWMMGKPGLMKKVIQNELRAGRRVSIVTFNVDLVAENALHCLTSGRPGAQWCLNKTYGFSPEKESLVYGGRDYEDEFDYNGGLSEIPLFKMHGSVNWVFIHGNRHPPAELVSAKDRPFYVMTNQQLPQRALRLKRPTDRRFYYVSPLIIPPVYEKHGFIKRHLQDVWDGASQVLREASRVLFWGYSFPRADTHARHYFQGLSRENTALQNPITINPDAAAETALWSVLKPRSVQHFRSAEDYLAGEA